jgi:hypothetical protein
LHFYLVVDTPGQQLSRQGSKSTLQYNTSH